MVKKLIVNIVSLFGAVLAFTGTAAADVPYRTYVYSSDGSARLSPDAFQTERIIRLDDTEAGALKMPSDLSVSSQGDVFIADSENNRIVVLNSKFEVKKVIKTITDNSGKTISLNNPEGVFVTEENEIYIADTQNHRILVLDSTFAFLREIGAPVTPLIKSEHAYSPVSVAVDSGKRVYVVAKGITEGIIALSPQGDFDGFLGAQKVSVSAMDLFWRMFMNKEQKARTKKFVPTEYNNLTIDKNGFVYATTNTIDAYNQYMNMLSKSKSGNYAPIRKLNSKGIDVLQRNGEYPPAGDLQVEFSGESVDGPSSFIDVAIGENEVYSLFDSRKQRIFTYDKEGNLLYVFGEPGYRNGNQEHGVSIAYKGTDLLCLDKSRGTITVYSRTSYGDMINEALTLYNQRKYKESSAAWTRISIYNNNLSISYRNLGKSYYHSGEYEKAMECFKIVDDVAYYSKAFAEQRKVWMKDYILVVPISLIALILLWAFLMKKVNKYNKEADTNKSKNGLPGQLLYGFRVIFHPMDGFGEIKRSARGGVLSATIILAAALFAILFNGLFRGYIASGGMKESFSTFNTIGAALLIVLLFCTSNWCLSTLMNGEGSFKNIYISTCYSLIPIILILIPAAVVSNFFTADEVMLYSFVVNLAYFWVALLIFCSCATIHDYGFFKNLLTLILSVIGMMIITLIGVLFLNLVQQLILFVQNLFIELSFRF